MARTKHTEADSIDAVDLAPSTRIEFEGVVIDILMEFLGEQHGTPYRNVLHDHSTYELVIVEEGSLDYFIENEHITLNHGEFIIISPHVKHRVDHFTQTMRRFCLRFNFKSGAHLVDTEDRKYMRDTLSPDERTHIFSVISELRRLDGKALGSPATYRMRAQFGIIFSYVLERFMDTDTGDAAEASNQISLHTKIENYLYLNYSKSITLESLAAYLSYSRTQTQRIIEDCFGMSFTEKLREIRISNAKTLLANGDLSIDAIAEKCGYETRQGFEAMFGKHIGSTPNQYRKQYHK